MGTSLVSDRLETYARMQGGFRTFDFSQAQAFKLGDPNLPDQGEIYRMVLRRGKPMGGVCATLCAFWIVFHATQDGGKANSFTRGRSVWDYLFNENGINTGAAINITVEHHQSSGKQIRYLENFMRKFGVIRRRDIVSGAILENEFPMSYSRLLAAGEGIVAHRGGGYKLMSLRSSKGKDGHMVAAFAAQDVLFMDPNVGEFWLPNTNAFRAWWQFFMMNTYIDMFDRLIVRDYGVKA
jgi:hypothetical protein